MSGDSRPWYKKKRYAIPAGFVGLVFLGSISSATSTQSNIQAANVGAVSAISENTPVLGADARSNTGELSNNNYYTNVDSQSVHAPAYTSDGSIPEGATARCEDGSYSFSRNHRGTCSRHGGVSQWL